MNLCSAFGEAFSDLLSGITTVVLVPRPHEASHHACVVAHYVRSWWGGLVGVVPASMELCLSRDSCAVCSTPCMPSTHKAGYAT